MVKTNITTEEKAFLESHLKKSPLLLIRLKCLAILSRDKGMKVKDIADIAGKHEKTVSQWLGDWSDCRMASIFTGHKDNQSAAKLTKNQKKKIKEALSKPPSEYDITKEFWDVPALKEYVQAKFE